MKQYFKLVKRRGRGIYSWNYTREHPFRTQYFLQQWNHALPHFLEKGFGIFCFERIQDCIEYIEMTGNAGTHQPVMEILVQECDVLEPPPFLLSGYEDIVARIQQPNWLYNTTTTGLFPKTGMVTKCFPTRIFATIYKGEIIK